MPPSQATGPTRIASLLLCSLFSGTGSLHAEIVINEILVDPEGSDSGREFVELFNPGPGSAPLNGLRFEFANGAEEASWRLRWEGAGLSDLPAGARFLITDRNWQGDAVPGAEVYLGLQNGPDAVRLVRDGRTLDLLGYGPLTDPAMYEGEPAPVAPGRSLARRPDGADSGRNVLDFVLTGPTPGGPNFRDWAIEAAGWNAEPPSVDRVGGAVGIGVKLRNIGLEAIAPANVELSVGGQVLSGRLGGLVSGGEADVHWPVRVDRAGTLPVVVRILPPAAPDTLALLLGALQAGPGPLVLDEVLAAPDQGQGEWIELRARADSLDLARFRLRDEDGDWRSLPRRILRAGDRAVVAQDSTALAAWLLENTESGLETGCGVTSALAAVIDAATGWPSLNNESASSRDFADRVYLADPQGVVIDHLTWEGPGEATVPAPDGGTSLERISDAPRQPGASLWAPCTAQAGSTPGCPNSLVVPTVPGLGFRVTPAVLEPAAGVAVLHALCEVPAGAVGLRLRIYDLWGGRVRDLGGDRLGPGPRDMIWDGRDDQSRAVPSGGYIFVVSLRGAAGEVLKRERQLVAVRRGGAR